jgi:hypothetical protein
MEFRADSLDWSQPPNDLRLLSQTVAFRGAKKTATGAAGWTAE